MSICMYKAPPPSLKHVPTRTLCALTFARGEVLDAEGLSRLHGLLPILCEGAVVEAVAAISDKQVHGGLGLLKSEEASTPLDMGQ